MTLRKTLFFTKFKLLEAVSQQNTVQWTQSTTDFRKYVLQIIFNGKKSKKHQKKKLYCRMPSTRKFRLNNSKKRWFSIIDSNL